MYLIGKITTTHGIKGELKVRNLSDYDRFYKGASVILLSPNQQEIEVTIEHVRPHQNALLVTLKGYSNINDVLQFVGYDVYSKVKPQNDDEFHYSDLMHMKVYDQHQSLIGEISGILEVPQGHILEIITPHKKILVPFVDAFVKNIENQEMTVELIEGML
jgi:16S rRNA processing protein RimM